MNSTNGGCRSVEGSHRRYVEVYWSHEAVHDTFTDGEILRAGDLRQKVHVFKREIMCDARSYIEGSRRERHLVVAQKATVNFGDESICNFWAHKVIVQIQHLNCC